MNYLPASVHREIVRRLRAGESIRRVAADLGVAQGSVQVRKAQLVWNNEPLPECQGGRVRPKSSSVIARRMAAVVEHYG